MKNLSNISLSGLMGLGVSTYSILSALIAGPFADPTMFGFGTLVVWAIYAIAKLDEPRPTRLRTPVRTHVVPFETTSETQRAA